MKNIYHALGLKYTIYSMAITEICFFRQFQLAAMNKIVGFMRIGIYKAQHSQIITTFHLSHIFKSTQQLSEANS